VNKLDPGPFPTPFLQQQPLTVGGRVVREVLDGGVQPDAILW
jgi:hypothetical protein